MTAGQLAPEALHDLARGPALGGVRERHRDRPRRGVEAHDGLVRLPVRVGVEVVDELAARPHDDAVLGLDERALVEPALGLGVDVARGQQLRVVGEQALHDLRTFDDLVGHVGHGAVAVREHPEVTRPRPEGVEAADVLLAGAGLRELVWPVQVDELA